MKPFLDTLAGRVPARPPVWLMRQAGRYLPEYRAVRAKAPDFVAFCLTPDMAIEVTLQPIRRYRFDAAILFADILLIPHGLGQGLAFKEGEGPVLEPIRDRSGVERLAVEGAAARLSPVYEAVAGIRAGLPPEVALIGFAGSPWTVATYMVEGRGGTEQATIRKMAWREPELLAALLDRVVAASVDYLLEQVRAGAEAIQLFDTWAGSVPGPLFDDLVIRPTRAIVERLKAAHPGLPVIGFPRGAAARLAEYAARTGVDAVGVDWSTDLGAVRHALPRGVASQGNLDPLLLAAGGDRLDAEIDAILDATRGAPHVFNLGHGIVPETNPEHVARLVARVRGEAR